MVNFSHSQQSLCSVFYNVKTFSICAVCYEKSIYLLCRQSCSRLCLNSVSWDSMFIYSSLKCHKLPLWLLLMKNAAFCGPSTWIFVLIKPSLLEESLSQKKIINLLILYIVKTEAILDKNLCRMTLISLFTKLNTLNCFHAADITLQECNQDNKKVYTTPC